MVRMCPRVRFCTCLLGLVTVMTVVTLATPAGVVAEVQHDEPSAEYSEGETPHGEGHEHKNHVAGFIGFTEPEEHHGEKADPDFTVGFDYERRFNKWFGAGAMLDWVAEGQREYLVGPLFILHAGGHAKFFAAPCYQRVREGDEGGEGNFVFRTGFAWDFFFGKYSVFPAVYYDFAEGQDFLVFGVGFGMGF